MRSGQATPGFNDIQRATRAPRDRVAERLRSPEAAEVIIRVAYSQHPPRYEYVLAEAGRAVGPVMDALSRWGANYVN
jgi:DNA-binding HxlR family transcriptional regulator